MKRARHLLRHSATATGWPRAYRLGIPEAGGGRSETRLAAKVGKPRQNIQSYRDGAEVAENLHIDMHLLDGKAQHLSAIHALHCVGLSKGGRGQKGGLSEYAAKVGKDRSNIRVYRDGAEVAEKVGNDTHVLHDKTQHLSAIHALPRACWLAIMCTADQRAKGG